MTRNICNVDRHDFHFSKLSKKRFIRQEILQCCAAQFLLCLFWKIFFSLKILRPYVARIFSLFLCSFKKHFKFFINFEWAIVFESAYFHKCCKSSDLMQEYCLFFSYYSTILWHFDFLLDKKACHTLSQYAQFEIVISLIDLKKKFLMTSINNILKVIIISSCY